MPKVREEVSTVAKTLSPMNGRRPYRALNKTMTTSDHVPESVSSPELAGDAKDAARLDTIATNEIAASTPQHSHSNKSTFAERNLQRLIPPLRTVLRVPQPYSDATREAARIMMSRGPMAMGPERRKTGNTCGDTAGECEVLPKLFCSLKVGTCAAGAPFLHSLE